MRNKKLLLLVGKAGVGKNTWAEDYRQAYPNERVKIYAFADHLKQCARDYYGWNGIKDERGRQLLINLGNHFRAYDPLLLIRIVQRKVENDYLYDNVDTFIISDCRFDNEISYIKDNIQIGKGEITAIELRREFYTKLTAEQLLDPTELGVDRSLVDEVVDLYARVRLPIKEK